MRTTIPAIFILSLFLVLPRLVSAAPSDSSDAPLQLVYQDQKFPVDKSTIESWQRTVRLPAKSQLTYEAQPVKYYMAKFVGREALPAKQTLSYSYDPKLIYQYIKRLAATFNVPVQEPELVIENGRAVSFTPPSDGLSLHAYEAAMSTAKALERGRPEVQLTATEVKPQKSLSSLNNLGIRELVARGESGFKGSPRNRRTNIKVGVEKMKGIIVKPGEVFSFNEHLGPVEAEYGFVPELVIKRTGTVPELGGGLCQVSSTTFRAAMDAGLPIKERRNHAYAVQYYAPQGTDATIYPGVVDLKFENDTPGAILIWPYFKDDNTLIFDFYGTRDNRQVTLEKPVQYDRKPDGSLKATWTRVVVKDGETSTSTFKSVYQPPALYHKEETFIPAASSTPSAIPVANSQPVSSSN